MWNHCHFWIPTMMSKPIMSLFDPVMTKIHHAIFKLISHSDIPDLTCSAAVGSLSRIAWAALLFLVSIAAANGVNPCLSFKVKSSPGCDMSSEMITWCWFSMAIWMGVLPSASCKKIIFVIYSSPASCSWMSCQCVCLSILLSTYHSLSSLPPYNFQYNWTH